VVKAVTEFLQSIRNNKFSGILFFFFILLLPTQLGKHFWPPFAFIDGLQIDYLSPTLYLTDVIVLLFIITTVKKMKWSFLFFLFLLFLSLGIFLSKQPFSGWYGLVKIMEYFFLWNTITQFLSEEKNPLGKISIPIALSILVESILSLAQFFLQRSIGTIIYFFGERTFNASTPGIANASINGELIMRPYGTFPHPNVLAGFLVIGLTIVLQQFFLEKKLSRKIFFLSVVIIGTSTLFVSLSRIAIILWIICGLYLVTKNVSWKENRKFFSLIFIFCVSLISGLLFVSHANSRLENISLSDESVAQRIFLFSKAWNMLAVRPFLGVGFDNFLINLRGENFGGFSIILLQPVHNIFMLLLVETGIFGFSFCGFFLFQTIKQIIISVHKKLLPFMVILLMEWAVIGLFDHYLVTLQQGQLLSVLLFSLGWSFKKKSSTIVL